MSRLSAVGVAADLPPGWEGRIRDRKPPAVAPEARVERPLHGPSLLHAANFPLPAEVADFGGGAVELMSNRDLLVVLFEYDRASAEQPLFAAQGFPRLSVDEFSPFTLQRLIEGQGGAQRFFSVGGRAFCLYVVLGSHLRRFRTVAEVNDVLAAVTVD